MLLVNKDKDAIINIDQITSIHVGGDGCTLKAEFANGNGCQVGRYGSNKEARMAIEIVAEVFGETTVCLMPDDNSVRAGISLMETRYHHATGKKTKGHGGS